MKLSLLFISFCFWGISAHAQQNHFVYLQTDNKQPFYVQVNDKVFSSSASGYVVIPKLQNGTYNFSIGFPKNEWPQQTIPVIINNKDAGFILKNFDKKGWGLFDMQTLNVIMPATDLAKTEVMENKTDEFSNVLADVVNTPSLKEKQKETEVPVTKTEVPVQVIVNEIKKTEAPVPVIDIEVKKTEVPVPVIDSEVKKTETIQSDFIKVLSSSIDNDGRTMVIVDHSAANHDTVRIFIPYERNTAVTEISTEVTRPDTVKQITQANIEEEKKTKDTKFINIELPNPNATTDTTKVITTEPVKPVDSVYKEVVIKENIVPSNPFPKVEMINSDCKNFATESDFLKARKKMVDESTDDKMVVAARKFFRSKCFSTEQVKNLSVLFLQDDGKYKFFDSAYPFVHDTKNFSSLEMQLKDEYYITRFRAMIRH